MLVVSTHVLLCVCVCVACSMITRVEHFPPMEGSSSWSMPLKPWRTVAPQ